MLIRIALLGCSLLLAASGCSPGLGRIVPAVAPVAGTPGAAVRGDAHHGAVAAKIVLRIPLRRHRHAHYLSPSTAAVSVTIAPAGSCVACTPKFTANAQLAPNAPSCSIDTATNGLTCTIAFTLSPGRYTGSMATYDAWNAGTQSPSGNVLSQNQSFPIDVVAGHANVPNITLAGIPNSIEVLPLTGDLSMLPSADFGGTRLEITPLKSASLLAVALDADGNAIFGPGSPAFSVTVGGGYTTSILGNNVLIRSPQTPAKGSWPITVGTTTCSGGGTCSTSNWTISAAPLVAVAQANPPSVSVYAGLGSKLDAAIATSSLSSPQAVAFDLHGNLFVANATGGPGGKGSISEYAPPYTQTAPTTVITSGISTPSALAVSRINGNLAVLNTGGGAPTVAVYAPGSTTPISTPFATSAGLSSIAFDSSDNLWYSTTLPSGNVKELLAAGKYASAGTDVVVGGTPSSIVLDGSGDLYVADSAAESVSEYSAPAYASPTAIIGSLTGSPRLIINNNLPAYFGHYDGATLLGIAASNTFAVYEPFETSFLMNYGDAAFQAQAYDQDANLWLGPNNPYPYSGFGYISWRSFGQELNTREAVGNGIAAFPAP